MSVHRVGQPCRNFNILGSTTLIDPRDNREKVVLSNFAAGATGNLILIDPQTGDGESIPLPGDEGAWALLNLDDETLLVGTCPRAGYLHRLDLRTRTWAEPLADPGESYIWNLCRGRDGLVYGGTYPGCVLLRYDPAAHRLDNVGRMSDNPDNLYSRHVYAVGDAILVECWSAAHHLTLWDMRTQTAQPFGRPGAKVKAVTAGLICTETDGELDFYDAATLQPIAAAPERLPVEPALPYSGSRHMLALQDGRIFAVRGQDYYILDPAADGPESRPPLHSIPTPKPPTRIHTITVAPGGTVWGACGFGQTIFSCDPQTGEFWNSGVVCDQGGEVYGMAFAADRLFLSAYVGGDHVVYDPAQPWNQVDNANPRTLQPAGPALIRPEARSVIGPDGAFWTGWMARYGVYGGGLSRVDVETGAVTVWEDPIPGQALMSLAADERYLYFTTGGAGNGLPTKSEPFHFVVWEPAQGLIWQQPFPLGSSLGRVAAVDGRVLVFVDRTVDQTIQVFDPGRMAWEATVACAAPCQTLLALADGSALAFCDTHLWRIDPRQGTSTRLGDLPGPVQAAATAPGGAIYFAHLTELYRLDLPESI